MKKNIFAQFPALILVLFGALFFFGCSAGGGDDDDDDYDYDYDDGLPDGLDTALTNIGIGDGYIPLPEGATLAGWKLDEYKFTTYGSYQYNIYWTGASETIFGTYKAALATEFGKAGTADNPDTWIIGWDWSGADKPEYWDSATLYFIKDANDELPLNTLQLCLDVGNPQAVLTIFGLINCPVPSGVNFYLVDDDTTDTLNLFWAGANESVFASYKAALQTYFEKTGSINDKTGIKGWDWVGGDAPSSKGLQNAALQYLLTDFSGVEVNLVAGTLALYLKKTVGP
jgi:hypothetical protein